LSSDIFSSLSIDFGSSSFASSVKDLNTIDSNSTTSKEDKTSGYVSVKSYPDKTLDLPLPSTQNEKKHLEPTDSKLDVETKTIVASETISSSVNPIRQPNVVEYIANYVIEHSSSTESEPSTLPETISNIVEIKEPNKDQVITPPPLPLRRQQSAAISSEDIVKRKSVKFGVRKDLLWI